MLLVEKSTRTLNYFRDEYRVFQDRFDEIGDFGRGEVRCVKEAILAMDVFVIGSLFRLMGDGSSTSCCRLEGAKTVVGETSSRHAQGAGQKSCSEFPEGLLTEFEYLPPPRSEEAGGVELLEPLIVVVGSSDEDVMLRRASPAGMQGVNEVILYDGRQVVDKCVCGSEPLPHKDARDIELKVVDGLNAGEGELARMQLVGVVGHHEARGSAKHEAPDMTGDCGMALEPAKAPLDQSAEKSVSRCPSNVRGRDDDPVVAPSAEQFQHQTGKRAARRGLRTTAVHDCPSALAMDHFDFCRADWQKQRVGGEVEYFHHASILRGLRTAN